MTTKELDSIHNLFKSLAGQSVFKETHDTILKQGCRVVGLLAMTQDMEEELGSYDCEKIKTALREKIIEKINQL